MTTNDRSTLGGNFQVPHRLASADETRQRYHARWQLIRRLAERLVEDALHGLEDHHHTQAEARRAALPQAAGASMRATTDATNYPPGALVRLSDICGDRKAGRPGLLPINPATWYRWVKEGRAPAGRRLGRITRVWTVEEVLALARPIEATS